MTKPRHILFFTLAFLLLLGGCSGRGAPASYDPDKVAESILEAVTFRDDLTKVDESIVENHYALDDAVHSYAIYVSGSGATAEEVAVLKVGDADDLPAAKAMLEKRVDEQKKRYESYVPGEMVKLGSPVIISQGDVAVLVLADDAAAAEQAVRDALK